MSLTFKKEQRENLQNLEVYIDDKTPLSPNFFRVSDVPQILHKGKNLLRIKVHPTNLVDGSKILIDVRDSNGNPIYFEIPDYIEDDKSRVISIWIYHNNGDDNTPNGNATITIVGESKVDLNGNPIPDKFKGKPNIKWGVNVLVDRGGNNISPVIFNPTSTPTLVVSESIESFENLPTSGTELTKLSSGTIRVSYLYKGNTAVAQLIDGSTFNQEMVGHPLDFNTPAVFNKATPTTNIPNPISLNYNPIITSVVDSNTVILDKPYTTTFKDRVNLIHTFNSVDTIRASVNYFSTASNQTSENKRSYANITFSNVDPIVGLVDKVKVLIKSDGLPGEYELLHEVQVPFSSSFTIKVPIPSEHLKDAKKLRIQYLNYGGEISKTLTTSEAYVFQGGNYYFAGNDNLVTGSMYLSNEIGKGMEMSGRSSGIIQSVGYEGQIRAAAGSAPGGFIIYSGSFTIGSDSLSGVGLQLVGGSDDRHMIFTTAGGGVLDIKTDKFFVGNTGSQFISGSDGNIEISSSNFHLQPNGDVTLNGTVTATAGDIGGFTITSQSIESKFEISSSINALALNASGSISGSNLLIRQNYGGTLYELINTQAGVADFRNLGRVLVQDNTEYVSDVNPSAVVVEYPVRFLEGETHMGISFQAKGTARGVVLSSHNVIISIANALTGSSTTIDYYDSFESTSNIQTYPLSSTGTGISTLTSSYSISPGFVAAAIQEIPAGSLNKYSKIIFSLSTGTSGANTRIKNINIFATRQFSANASSGAVSDSPALPEIPS
tara:strand:- start:38530 stop:40854 length:2325 start_codon:yes stop_codon:yes gene_type:complete